MSVPFVLSLPYSKHSNHASNGSILLHPTRIHVIITVVIRIQETTRSPAIQWTHGMQFSKTFIYEILDGTSCNTRPHPATQRCYSYYTIKLFFDCISFAKPKPARCPQRNRSKIPSKGTQSLKRSSLSTAAVSDMSFLLETR